MDAVIFERLGIPAVPIVTRPFLPTATAVAELDGLPDDPSSPWPGTNVGAGGGPGWDRTSDRAIMSRLL